MVWGFEGKGWNCYIVPANNSDEHAKTRDVGAYVGKIWYIYIYIYRERDDNDDGPEDAAEKDDDEFVHKYSMWIPGIYMFTHAYVKKKVCVLETDK